MTKSKIFCSAIALFVGSIFAMSAWAQQPAPKLTMKMLKPDVWVGLGGAGGNSTIIRAQWRHKLASRESPQFPEDR